jgi:two-component system, NtrC family, sensor kinase
MRRRSRAGGEPANVQRRKTGARKSRITPKVLHPRSSSAARKETKVARLTRQRDEASQQQAATADVLKVISRSTFDLQTVFDTLTESAARLCDAEIANIWRPADGAYRMAASYGVTSRFKEYSENREYLETIAIEPGHGSIVGWTLLTGKVVHVRDVQADPDYKLSGIIALGSYRTTLGVPLLREGVPIGVLFLARTRVEPFTQQQIDLITTFADQAVIAVENTRLLNELRDSLQQQTATADVLKVISRSAFDLEAVLNTLVESAARVCEADRGIILRPTGKNASYYYAASYGHAPEFIEHQRTLTFEPGRGGASGRVLLERRSVQITDVLADPEYTFREAAKLGNFRTILGVPLLREGIPIGIFLLHRVAVRPFTEKHIKLVETFADQAVIAIESVRLFEAEQQRTRELAESLEQQTATSEVLQVISSSPGDLQSVFAAMLENAVRICSAKFGVIYRWDDDALHLVASHNLPPAYAKIRGDAPFRPPPQSPTARMMESKSVTQVADLAAEQAYAARDPAFVEGVELGGIRTLLSVPMLKEDKLAGAFTLYRQEVRPFTDKQIELVQNFASQAVIAIENARLLNELRQRTTDLTERTADLTESLEQQTATSEVLQVISSSPGDLEPVFATMLEKAVRICDATFGNIYRWDGKLLHLLAAHNTPPALAEFRRRSALRPSLIRRMIETKTATNVVDMSEHPDYVERRTPSAVAAVELGGVRSFLSVPMVKENELIGSFSLYRQEVRPFTEKQIALVTSFAAQAVIATGC